MSDALSNLIKSGLPRRQAAAVLASASGAAAPEYSHNPETGVWTVTPGQNPGSAMFGSGTSYSTDSPPTSGGLKTSQIPLGVLVPNDDVATLVDSTHWAHAAAGLYLITGNIVLFPVTTTGVEEYLQVEMMPDGLTQQYMNISEWVMNSFGAIYTSVSGAVLADDDVAFNGQINIRSKTHVWQGQAQVTIVRLD